MVRRSAKVSRMAFQLEFLGDLGESFPYEGKEILRDVRSTKIIGVRVFAAMTARHPVITRFEIKDNEGILVAEGPDNPPDCDGENSGHQGHPWPFDPFG
jgi:hypothetical protein